MCLYYNMTYCFLHATRSQNTSQSFSSQHSGCDPLDFEMHLVRKRLCSFADIMSAISSGVASVHAIKNKIIMSSPFSYYIRMLVSVPTHARSIQLHSSDTNHGVFIRALRLTRRVQLD